MGYGYNNQPEQKIDYQPFLKDNGTGEIVVWVDQFNRFWTYDRGGVLVECDDRGQPFAPPPHGGGNYPQQPRYRHEEQVPRMPGSGGGNQVPPSNGGRKYGDTGGASIGIGGGHRPPSSVSMSGNSRPYKGSGGQVPKQPEVIEQVTTPEEKIISLYDAGYKAQYGNEFIPLYDDTVDEVEVIVDEEGKTFRFVIKKIGR